MTPDDPRHGSYAGYQQHIYAKDKPCSLCARAGREYHRKHRETHPERRENERRLAAARSRALERLSDIYPGLFDQLLREELQK